jgi:signal transduction histidine kinase
VIQVRDAGEGVPEDALELIFKPFYRVAEAANEPRSASGRAVDYSGSYLAAPWPNKREKFALEVDCWWN